MHTDRPFYAEFHIPGQNRKSPLYLCIQFLKSVDLQDKNGPTDHNIAITKLHNKCACVFVTKSSRVTESRDIDSHVSGMPQAESRDQVTLLQQHTAASPVEAF